MVPNLPNRCSILGLGAALSLAGCQPAVGGMGDSEEERDPRLFVVATSGVLAELADWLLGDVGEVHQWMDEGVDPHRFMPRRGHLSQLRRASVVLTHGPGIEGSITAVLSSLPESVLVIRTDGGAGVAGLHNWHDPQAWADCVEDVARALGPLVADPAGMRRRASTRANALRSLAAAERERFAKLPSSRRLLVTVHGAFSGLGRSLDLEVASVSGNSTGAEPGLGRIHGLIQRVMERRLPVLFPEVGVPESMLRQVAARCRSRGAKVVLGQPLYSGPNSVPKPLEVAGGPSGPGTGSGDVASSPELGRVGRIFRANTSRIYAGLACGLERPSPDSPSEVRDR